MFDITFEIGGRKVRPDQVGDAFEQAILSSVKEQIISQIRDIRDPDTGERPKIVVKGRDLDNLTIEVRGSEKLVKLVEERLAD